MKRSVYVQAACHPEEKARWDALVDELGLPSLSALIRHALRRIEADTHVGSESTEGKA